MVGPRLPAVVDASGRPLDPSHGYLLVFREDALVAVPYDWSRLRVTGEPIPVSVVPAARAPREVPR